MVVACVPSVSCLWDLILNTPELVVCYQHMNCAICEREAVVFEDVWRTTSTKGVFFRIDFSKIDASEWHGHSAARLFHGKTTNAIVFHGSWTKEALEQWVKKSKL